MAGHSKWANIRHKKGKADAQRGKIFSRIAKEIISAVKQGGPDPKANPRLRLAIQKAKSANMPNENVERNVKKASQADQADYMELTYELYGHGGVGILVDMMTDNKNRAASEIKIATNKRGGTIASVGAVAYNFSRQGVIHVPKEQAIEDELFLTVSEAGAEDFEVLADTFMVITPPDLLYTVKEEVDALQLPTVSCNLEMLPKVWVSCEEKDKEANFALIEWLEGIDDVDAVYHNME